VRVLSARGDFTAHPAATDAIASIGPVDVVVLAVKAHQIGPIVADLRSLYHESTSVIAMQNGVPWWYFQGVPGPYENHVIRSVDPDGSISASIEPNRIVGCVIYCSTEIESPGVIRHLEGTRYSLGDPAGGKSERTTRIAEAFVAGGLKAPVENDIRPEIWLKLLGNASFNPISALTRATLVEMCDDPGVEQAAATMMREANAVANALGVTVPLSIEQRIDGARRVGAHKTSMLQDLEARKALELDAVTGAIIEMGTLAGIPTPATAQVYALAKLLERSVLAGR